MQNLDYDDVKVVLKEKTVDPLKENVFPIDLSLKLGTLESSLPVIFYYSDKEGKIDQRVEDACKRAGVLTAGAAGSLIPYLSKTSSHVLFESMNPADKLSVSSMKELKADNKFVLATCSIFVCQGVAVTNAHKCADALLVGATLPSTFKTIDSLGMFTPRISMTKKLANLTDSPVITTAGSAADTCKAFVAGADAVLINIGGPFEEGDDVEFVVSAIASSLKENLETLCSLAGVNSHKELSRVCELVVTK